MKDKGILIGIGIYVSWYWYIGFALKEFALSFFNLRDLDFRTFLNFSLYLFKFLFKYFRCCFVEVKFV